MRFWIACLVAVLSSEIVSHSAAAYQEAILASGGSVSGIVRFDGKPPAPRRFALIIYPDFDTCNRSAVESGYRHLEEVIVSDFGGLKDAVVVVEGVKRGKPFTQQAPVLRVKDCGFSPFVMTIRNPGELTIDNQDPIFHDLQAYGSGPNSRIRRLLEKPLRMNSVRTERIELASGQNLLRVQCGMHAFMQTWAKPVESPYFAVTAEDGRFDIVDLPPGTYRLTAWHPRLGLQSTEITVPPGGRVKAEFRYDGSQLSKNPPGR